MSEITSIYSKQADPQTVGLLKELLAKAESGELKSIMYVDSYRDGTIGNGWSGEPDMLMMANLDEIKFKFFMQMYFPEEDDEFTD